MCSEVAGKGKKEWVDRLVQVLLTNPVQVVQEANQILEEHGYHMEELKRGLM